jgi:hypothetical protein
MYCKTQHRKIKIEQHEPHKKPGVNSGTPEGLAVPDIILFLNVVRYILTTVNIKFI